MYIFSNIEYDFSKNVPHALDKTRKMWYNVIVYWYKREIYQNQVTIKQSTLLFVRRSFLCVHITMKEIMCVKSIKQHSQVIMRKHIARKRGSLAQSVQITNSVKVHMAV